MTTQQSRIRSHAPPDGAASAQRLFCFPHAGGSAALFRRRWQAHCGEIEVFPVQLPGRGQRSKLAPIDRVSALVADLAEELREQLDVPFAFFGHSMGALIAFELARLLRRRREDGPVHLFLAACAAPQLERVRPVERTSALPEHALVERLRCYGGIPDALLENRSVLRRGLPVLRADLRLIEAYRYVSEPPLDCPITIFGGLADSLVDIGELEGWRRHTSSRFGLELVAGDHFFVDRFGQRILRTIEEDLRKLRLPAA